MKKMTEKVCMGNEAIAKGAVSAGVSVVCGYPGTPSTEIIETIIAERPEGVRVQWSVNEKAALEVAAGASYAGARTLVTMKQVGLNVASDPLMSLAYIGVKGGMVVAVADDPGPWSSQTEQDTRRFAGHAKLPVFDPSSPEEAYEMTRAAYGVSEEFSLPVFLRPTTRVCHASATVTLADENEIRPASGFEKKADWCIFPALSYRRHGELEEKRKLISDKFSEMDFNRVELAGRKGIAASGISYLYAKEAISGLGVDVSLFKAGTPYPLPEKAAEKFLSHVESVLVIEELDPVLEEQLALLAGGRVKIYGKRTGSLPYNGEYSCEKVRDAIMNYLGIAHEEESAEELPQLPVRPPVLCAGCPHRASFCEVKEASAAFGDAIFCGDIGCYTLGNAYPLNMVDTCLCMGAGVTVAQGLALAEPHRKCVAFIGDSTFFHTGIPGVLNAVYQDTDVTIVVLDNRTTAMTGHQPHPGTGITALGKKTKAADIETMLRACGVVKIAKTDPFDYHASVEEFRKAIAYNGPSAVIAEAPCAAHTKKKAPAYIVDGGCIGCLECVKKTGCPAITVKEDGKAAINGSLCAGCSLCSVFCPVGAIKRSGRDA